MYIEIYSTTIVPQAVAKAEISKCGAKEEKVFKTQHGGPGANPQAAGSHGSLGAELLAPGSYGCLRARL